MNEFKTAPDDPEHVTEVIDHIACLSDDQIEQIRRELNLWKRRAR